MGRWSAACRVAVPGGSQGCGSCRLCDSNDLGSWPGRYRLTNPRRVTERHALTDLRIHTDDDAENRLKELGLSFPVMETAMRAGLRAYVESTDDDPSVLRGLLLVGKTVRSLREQLKPHGWRRESTRNLELTVQTDGPVKLMVTRGTAATGDPKGRPETKRERGQAVVDELREQGTDDTTPTLPGLEDMESQRGPNPSSSGSRWILLYHRDGNTLNAELSSPFAVDLGARISQWRERIILPPVVEGSSETEPEAA